MLELLLLPFLVLFLLMAFYLRGLRKHDEVLYRFCQIRRDAVSLLWKMYSKDGCNVNMKDYAAVRHLIDGLNNAIRMYRTHKTVIFNFRRFVLYIKEYNKSAKRLEEINLPENDDVSALYQRVGMASASAFLAYTPLIRSEMVFELSYYIASKLANIGVGFIRKQAEFIRAGMFTLGKQAQKTGVPLRIIRP